MFLPIVRTVAKPSWWTRVFRRGVTADGTSVCRHSPVNAGFAACWTGFTRSGPSHVSTRRCAQIRRLPPSWLCCLGCLWGYSRPQPTVGIVGAVLVVTQWGNPFGVFAGAVLVAIAWLLRPRPIRRSGDPLDPASHPALWRLADSVCNELGTRPPNTIVFSNAYNACVYEAGWRRERVLEIGVPLFGVLEPAGRVALISHEMAHFASGDPSRGALFGWAWSTVAGWVSLLWPQRSRQEGLAFVAEVLTSILMFPVAVLLWWVAVGLQRWTYDESQRAEYLADRLGARLAGTDGFAELLDQLLVSDMMAFAVQRAALGSTERDAIQELRHQLAEIPARERERHRRRAAASHWRVDTTHPPTTLRLAAIDANPVEPTLVLDEAWAEQLESELTPAYARASRELVDAYRWSIS